MVATSGGWAKGTAPTAALGSGSHQHGGYLLFLFRVLPTWWLPAVVGRRVPPPLLLWAAAATNMVATVCLFVCLFVCFFRVLSKWWLPAVVGQRVPPHTAALGSGSRQHGGSGSHQDIGDLLFSPGTTNMVAASGGWAKCTTVQFRVT